MTSVLEVIFLVKAAVFGEFHSKCKSNFSDESRLGGGRMRYKSRKMLRRRVIHLFKKYTRLKIRMSRVSKQSFCILQIIGHTLQVGGWINMLHFDIAGYIEADGGVV